MNPPLRLRPEERPSLQLHRKQLWTQILLPILAGMLLFFAAVALTSVATFRPNGDVSRWAAISTIWLVLPVIVSGLVLLVILVAFISLLVYLPPLIPPYTYLAQQFTYRIQGGARRIAEIAHNPTLVLKELPKLIRSYLADR